MNEIPDLVVPKTSSVFLLVKKCINYNNGTYLEESISVFLSDDHDSVTFKAHSEKLFLVIFYV